MKKVEVDGNTYKFSNDDDFIAWNKVRASCDLFNMPSTLRVLEMFRCVRDEFSRAKVPDDHRFSRVVQQGQIESQLLALGDYERVAYGVFEVLSRSDWSINEVRWDFRNHCSWSISKMFTIYYTRLVDVLRAKFALSIKTHSVMGDTLPTTTILAVATFELNGWSYEWSSTGNSSDDAEAKIRRIFEENVDIKNPHGLVADMLGQAARYFVKELWYEEFSNETYTE